MATRRKLTKEQLTKLGVDVLSDVLVEEASRNAGLKQRLVLLLASEEGPNAVAQEVRKRIATIARSTSFVDWKGIKRFGHDLQMPLDVIVRQIAPVDRALALELMWRFLDVSEPCLNRCDDSNGAIIGIFHEAVEWLGDIASNHRSLPEAFADQVFERLQANDYGVYDNLLSAVYPALNAESAAHLKQCLMDWHETAMRSSDPHRMGATAAKLGLQALADAEGDVDSFIETHDEKSLRNPAFVARIAMRLVAAGRATDALSYLDGAVPDGELWIQRME